jgi:hypothetical protein
MNMFERSETQPARRVLSWRKLFERSETQPARRVL